MSALSLYFAITVVIAQDRVQSHLSENEKHDSCNKELWRGVVVVTGCFFAETESPIEATSFLIASSFPLLAGD